MAGRTGNHPLPGAEHRPPWWLSEVESTGSTNTDLMEAALGGAPDGTVLRADHQSAGRGRLDRRWEAPAGANLLVSVLFRRHDMSAHSLVRSVAVAARRAVARVTAVDPGLKWPNDLVVDDVKLGGILAQVVPDGSGAIVVGLGLNVGWAPEGATSLAGRSAATPAPRELLLVLLDELERCTGISAAELDAEYRASLVTLGRRVKVSLPDGAEIVGRAVDVDIDGRLAVETDNGTLVFDTGDIVHLRNAD